MEKIRFEIQEAMFKLENDEILFTSKTLMNLKLENRFIRLSSNEKEGKPIVLKAISLEEMDKHFEDNIGYLNTHVYARIAGNRISPNMIDTITLGADPEFYLADDTTKSSKSFSVIQLTKKDIGEYGRDIGMDGAGFIGEFRPIPGKTEEELTGNLKALIDRTNILVGKAVERGRLATPRERWRLYGHSYYEGRPSGFHIHLGLPQYVLSNRDRLISLVRSLDYFLGIPCLKIDKQYHRRIRIPGQRHTGNYGKAFAFKYGSVTLEYRMPGGYHLRHPDLTRGIIGIAALVAEDFTTRAKFLRKRTVDEAKLYKGPPYKEVQNAFCRVEHPEINRWLEDVYDKLGKMITYDKHKQSVSFMLHAAANEPDISEDIFSNWEVV
jgi:hypothetical protein